MENTVLGKGAQRIGELQPWELLLCPYTTLISTGKDLDRDGMSNKRNRPRETADLARSRICLFDLIHWSFEPFTCSVTANGKLKCLQIMTVGV